MSVAELLKNCAGKWMPLDIIPEDQSRDQPRLASSENSSPDPRVNVYLTLAYSIVARLSLYVSNVLRGGG